MLKPDLDLDDSIERLGSVQNMYSWHIDGNDEYVHAFRRYFRINVAMGNRGWLNSAVFGFTLNDEHAFEKNPDGTLDYSRRTKLYYFKRRIFDSISELWNTQLLVPLFGDQVVNKQFNMERILQEMINNAIEHGTQWCVYGDVEVRAILGEQGLLCVVENPSHSILKLNEFLQRQDSKELRYKFLSHSEGDPERFFVWLRGFGYTLLRSSPDVEARVENLSQGGVRITLFFPIS